MKSVSFSSLLGFTSLFDTCRVPLRGQLPVDSLPFHHVGPRYQAQGARLGSKLSHLTNPGTTLDSPLPTWLHTLACRLKQSHLCWLSGSRFLTSSSASAPGLFPFRILELGQQLPLVSARARAVSVGSSFSLGTTFPSSPDW